MKDKYDIAFDAWQKEHPYANTADFLKTAFLGGMHAGMVMRDEEEKKIKEEWWQQEDSDLAYMDADDEYIESVTGG